ncbi:beta-ketoacyl-[acyl-carrier-protein] synthase I [Streptomyces sp. NBRC 110611]|uniref:type I polyketide synthase n=1 Tax=Streptomyces sp. NBRC 110611 TaxID=1621259 RepID=UPI0008583328|nr:type I polyketide synthase [Streptomyces sp. NBRC 110611]GAU68944.1 beta-ketoacyl-[acyl-carrier-protein] synthase I [Streptomyces sp. NBRC 110611]
MTFVPSTPDTVEEPNARDDRDTVDGLNTADGPAAADGADTAPDANHIAITGMAGRFPGAPDIDAFWQNLEAGRETIAALTDEELLASGVAPDELKNPRYVRAKGVLEDGDRFDAAFFGYTPREAELMDPQHRVFLECAWAALESAGCDPSTFEGRIGVFAGTSLNSYLLFNIMGNREAYDSAGLYRTLLAGDKDFLATRASYKFDLKGPAITVQTACSTSLTAVHLACQSLLNGECDIALAGGVSVSVPLQSGYVHEQGGILSADGHCRAFDADADGTVAGNGAGVVVLRRLADARDHGDEIEAVVRGTAVNNDGALKAGYTAPSVEGQSEVIAEALAVAEVDPATVGYVETHGTGTALGDPIEIAALTRAYREHTDDTGYCAIGSVKTSVGHLDAAAGVTALIKAALALKRQAIPASLGFSRPNPELALAESPFFVNDTLRPWPRQDGAPRRAGVSAFGIGGTNVHVVLEEAPATGPGGPSRSVQPLPLSARTASALVAGARRLADHLERHPEAQLGDVAHTLALGRRAFGTRGAVAARDRAEAVTALRALTEADARPAGDRAPVAFLFPGQGSQYAGMARALYEHEPHFAEEIDRCAGLFAPHLGTDLRTLLFPEPGQEDAAHRELEQTALTQPALFTVEYALARLWNSWGVRPSAMAGHSVGEYVAACLAGVFSLPDAVRLVAARGRLVQAMPTGAMLTVFLPEDETLRWLGEDGALCLAAVNSTRLSVVSGSHEAVEALRARLTAAGVASRALHTSHAFHSPSMDGAVGPFVEEVRTVRLSAPEIPFCSDVTGTWITDEQATSPEYWGRHLRGTVRFADVLDVLLADPDLVTLEVGPGQALANFTRQHAAWHDGRTVLGSLRHPKDKRDDRAHLAQTLGALWSAGAGVDWQAYFAGERRRPLRLPGYAFERQRYWIEPDPTAGPGPRAAAVAPAPLDDWFYTPGWKRRPHTAGRPDDAREALWAVLGTDLALGRELAQRLEAEGATVVRVGSGSVLARDGERSWTVDPTAREHLTDLVKSLDAEGPRPLRLVHLWSTATGPAAGLDTDRLDAARRAGFDSLLALAQALGEVRPAAPVTLDVLARGLYSVTGDEPLQPENATLLGACTVIGQEIAGVTCRTLDLTGTDPHQPGESAVRAVRDALGTPPEERELALRGTHWWIRDFDATPLPEGRTRLRDGGVYLITGGLGGIGLALAEHLAGAVEHPVIGLLSRSAFPAEDTWDAHLAAHGEQDADSVRIRRLRRVQELGARTVVLRGDVTDRDQTARAVAALRRHGPLNGVVHAAGLPSRGLITGKTPEEAGQVLAAKTHGTLVLDEVCGTDELDFLVLCSSLTSLLGGPGQSDYCAANAFLDAYAQWKRRATGVPVTAVAWDTWRGVGMAAGLAARLGGTAADDGEPTGHPLLSHLVESAPGSRTYRTELNTADTWVIADHRIMGHGLVPGTTYLELVRAAVAEEADGRAVELRDVLFALPVVVPDGHTRRLYTTVDTHDGRQRFTVRSNDGTGDPANWQTHAVGTIAFPDPDGPDAAAPRDIEALRREFADARVVADQEELRQLFKLNLLEQGGRIEFTLGPRWHCLRRVHVGQDRLLVELALDDAFLADLDGYALHPALLDVAGVSARIQMRDGYYLPFTYSSLRVHGALTGSVLCDVRLKGSDDAGETLMCDIDLLDPHGRVLVRIAGFTLKRINDVDAMVEQIEQATDAAVRAGEDAGGAAEGPAGGGTLRTLAEGIAEQDGVAAFARLLAAPALPEQLVVCHHGLATARQLARSLTPEVLAREIEAVTPPGGSHPRPDLDTPYAAPATDTERAVAAIWQEVLGIDGIGVDDDFFALGGHSLAAVQVGAKIQTRFGTEIELQEFFNEPTVAHTVALLAAGGGRRGPEDAIPVLSRGTAPGAADGAPQDAPDDLDVEDLSDEEVEAMLREVLAEDAAGPGEHDAQTEQGERE